MPATIQRIQKPKRARALDTSGNNNHGQIYSGRALEFDGVSDYLDLGAQKTYVDYSAETTQANRAWTVACWIYLEADVTGTTPDHIIGGGGISAGYCCVYHGTNKLAIWDIDADGAGGSADGAWRQGNTALELKTWYRALWVFDGDETVTMYLNGVADGSGRIDTQTDNGDLSMRYIGAITVDSDPAVARLWNGKLADLQLWQGAFTADDALYDYNNPEQLALNRSGTSLTNSNLKAWYPMNDGHRGQQSYILDASNTGLGDEMLTNGDFSTGSTGDTTISGWNKKNTDGSDPTTYELSNEQTYNGHHTLKVTGSGNADGAKFTASYTAGTTYKLDMWVYVESGTFHANPPDTPFNSGSQNIVTSTTTGQWENIVNIVTADANSSDATDGFFLQCSGGAATFYIGEVSMKPVNDKNHATTVFYGDELIDTTEDKDMSGSNNWAPYNGGLESITLGRLRITVDGGGTAQGAQLSLSDMGNSIVAGRTYRIQADLDFISGSDTDLVIKFVIGNVGVAVKAIDGSPNNGTITTTEETYYADVVAGDASGALRINCSSATNNSGSNNVFTADNVSVKEVGTASGWTDADQQLDIPQTALQSYNQLLWCPAGVEDNTMVSVADNSNLDVDDKDFSLSCWIYPVTESDYLPIWRKGAAGSEGYALTINNSNYIALNLNDGSSHNSYANLTDAVVPSGKWSHVVVTCDRDSATGIKCYLNGELQSATGDPTGENEDIGNSTTLRMLAWSEDDDDSFSGTATEFMLFKDSILTQAQVNELYNDGKALDGTTHSLFSTKCTAYYRNNGLASWPNLATVADSGATSTAAASGTVTHGSETMLITAGADASRDSQGFLMNRQKTTNSLNLEDNNRALIEVPDNTGFNFGNGTADSAFSITAWIYMNNATFFPICNKYKTGEKQWRFSLGSNDKLYMAIYDDSASEARQSRVYNTALTSYENQWIHVAATYDATEASGGISLYLNGTAVDDTDDNSGSYTAMEDKDVNLTIGQDQDIEAWADGKIDDLCIYSKELSAAEVKRNYNAGKRSHR